MAAKLRSASERGNVLVVTLLLTMILVVLGLTTVDSVTSATRQGTSSTTHQHCLFLAETGLDMALDDIRRGGSGSLGSAATPIQLPEGAYYTIAADRGGGVITLFAVGLQHQDRRTLRARIRSSNPVFHHAIFAGNASGDPDYEMTFGGRGAHGDEINGDVYSGGSILVEDDADLAGTVRSNGGATGVEATTGVRQPGFDFSGVDWTSAELVDVAGQFDAFGTRRSGTPGGTADELPEDNNAHIFRRNPSDRSSENDSTTKDDYYLEDPYEPMAGTDRKDDGSDNYMISLGDGPDDARVTYFIDGNLWIHNDSAYSFMLDSGGDGVQVTFIVRGNITFSDSFRMGDLDRDAVGFVALKDPDVEDSGNIYLGDPAHGTLAELHGFLYAEDDFLDINLDENGSKSVRILGSMTAGDQVAIERDYRGGHSKLTVDWDRRLADGTVSLPFLDTQLPSSAGDVVVEAWMESPLVDLSVGGGGS